MQANAISSKGQVVIPKNLRDQLGLRVGMRVQFREEKGELLLSVVRGTIGSKASSLEAGLGLAGYQGPRISDADIAAAVRKKAASRNRG